MLGTLSGPGGTLHLEPKVMNVLVCLAELAGEVVTHDQFIARVWRGRIVSDEVLSRCISLLRTRLGDDPREPRFIQTLPKIGYRLLTPVEPLAAPAAQPAEAPRPAEAPKLALTVDALQPPATVDAKAPVAALRRIRPRLVVGWTILGLLLVGAAGYLYLERWPRRATPPVAGEPTIAVLPFVNRSDDKDNEYFSDGLTEEIIDRLANVPGLQVVASTSAFALKNQSEDVREIGERLGGRYILKRSVSKEGERVRITAKLVDAASSFHPR